MGERSCLVILSKGNITNTYDCFPFALKSRTTNQQEGLSVEGQPPAFQQVRGGVPVR